MPGSLNLTRVRLRQESGPGANNGSIRAQGDFNTPPAFSAPPSVTVKIQDNLALNQTHTFGSCGPHGSGIRCSDTVGSSSFRADFKRFKGSSVVLRFRIRFSHIAIDGPFQAPVKVTLTHNGGVVRMDTIMDCKATNSGLNCREF